jgi:TonB family protein
MNRLLLCAICLWMLPLTGLGVASGAQDERPVYDDEIAIQSWVDLHYPDIAAAARVQGVVVVSATLNDDGSVAKATAISGQRLLVTAAVDNVRRWTFKPNALKRVVIVYDFRVEGSCRNRSSLFQLRNSNVVSIMTCVEPLNPTSRR